MNSYMHIYAHTYIYIHMYIKIYPHVNIFTYLHINIVNIDCYIYKQIVLNIGDKLYVFKI